MALGSRKNLRRDGRNKPNSPFCRALRRKGKMGNFSISLFENKVRKLTAPLVPSTRNVAEEVESNHQWFPHCYRAENVPATTGRPRERACSETCSWHEEHRLVRFFGWREINGNRLSPSGLKTVIRQRLSSGVEKFNRSYIYSIYRHGAYCTIVHVHCTQRTVITT